MEKATLGVAATTHQFTTIGSYAMIAGNAMVVKDVPPLAKYIPNKPLSVNLYAAKKWKLIVDDNLVNKLNEDWENKRHKERDKMSLRLELSAYAIHE